MSEPKKLTSERLDDFPPPAALIWRLPVIRHIRALYYWRRMDQHYAMWLKMGALPARRDEDERLIQAMWDGQI